MIHTAYTVRMLRLIACVLSLALLFWSTSLPGFFTAEASMTNTSATLSDSRPSTASNHTIQFTTSEGLIGGQTILLTFDAGFTLPTAGFDFNDIDLATGTDAVLAAAAGATAWGVSTSSNTVTLTAPSNFGIASATTVTIEIGSNAESGATGDSQIVNPSSVNSYPIDIAGTMPDEGQARVAIVDQVTVTAQVDTSLTFTVSGTTTNVTVNGSPTSTDITTTANAISYGTLAVASSTMAAQDLSVATNAANGFVVTVTQPTPFDSATGADINSFYDGTATNTPTAWRHPSATIGDDTTYGHWGLTSSDDLNADEFGSDLWVAASTTPRQVFEHNGVSNGQIHQQGYATVGYQIEISALQEAASDYDTELIYVATPTF